MKLDTASVGGILLLLQSLAGDKVMAQGCALAAERLNLTPEKVSLILVRLLNPDELIEQGEEMKLRGIGNPKTLRAYKDEGLFPAFMNGVHQPVKKGGKRQ